MRAAMEADLDFAFSDCDVGRDVDQITEDLASLSIGIAAHGFGEDAIEPTGDDEKDHVEIDLESDSGRQRIHVKEAHGIGQRVFNEHALCVSGDQFFGRYAVLVGEQNRGFVVAQI